ncbi:MAG TPA: membrane protein insertase YidC [Candidatus Polarisedimenticolia bacterium]|nr:membrane protein insertase YidC [Candidatus Polarisedimenticolia bacterium]
MERRLLLAVTLSVAFLLIWSQFIAPKAQKPVAPAGTPGVAAPAGAVGAAPAVSPEASPAAGGAAAAPAAGIVGATTDAPRPGVPMGQRIAAASEEEVSIETPLQSIRLSNHGARVASWRLKEFKDDKGEALDLVSPAGRKLDRLPLQILLEDAEASRRLTQALYQVTRKETTLGGHTVTEVSFTWSDGAGLAATKTLRVPHDSYLAGLELAAQQGGRPVAPTVVWGAGFGSHNGLESGRYADAPQAVLNLGGAIQFRAQKEIKPEAPRLDGGALAWAGLEDRYFAAILVPRLPGEGGGPGEGAAAAGAPAATLVAPVEGQSRVETLRLVEEGREQFFLSFALRMPGASRFDLFVGPKDYHVLKSVGFGLDRLLDFGFFAVVALPLFHALNFVDRYVGNYGWAIVIVTFLIRLVFFPLMYKSQIKMRVMQEKMKRVQPKLKALRERYHRLERKELEKGNGRARQQLRQKMNEEMMDLYKEEEINPFGTMSGCLPLLLQIPILYAFYRILTIAIELRKARFALWIGDLSQKDPYFVTPILMGITMLVQQVMTSSSIPDPGQRRMMYIMPVMFTWMFLQFPSGLVLYWLVSNLLGIAQQYLINKQAAAERKTA